MPEKKGFKTAAALLFILLCCLAGIFYVRGMSSEELHDIPITTSPIKQGLDEALKRFDSLGLKAKSSIITNVDKSRGPKAELVICGMRDIALISELISVLENNNTDVSFYITGMEASGYSDSLSLITGSGYPVGVSYDGSASVAGKTAARRAITDFVRASASIQLLTGLQPSTLLSLSAPDEDLLAAAYASSFVNVMVPARIVHLSSVASLPRAEDLLNRLPRGAVLCLQLDGMTADGVDYFRQLCAALPWTDLSKQASTLLSSPYEPAREQIRAYTTERAAAFTFTGLGNEEELNWVLKALELVRAAGTFFVSAGDLAQYPSQVQAVLSGGHALGIAAQSGRTVSAEALLTELLQVKETLVEEYGYTRPLPVRPAVGACSDTLRQACAAGGFTLLSAMVNAVSRDDLRQTDPVAVFEKQFPEKWGVLQRGEIVHFQMKQYQSSNYMLGELVKLIATRGNIYELKPVMDILGNRACTYNYPLAKESILPEVRDAIRPGQLAGDPAAAIQTRYTGIYWVDSGNMLPGFTWKEVSKLDKRGLVPNKQNMVFLTFDDWGTDKNITALLDVLKKHRASATFFVRTQYVSDNPNLLRAIAMEGHSIASHTHKHFPLSVDTGTGKKFADLSPAQVQELTFDLVTSYQVLQSIVGDISVQGRPALTKLFRPPTLAVSKSGMTAVLDCGFTHSVSGSYSTSDYQATDAVKLANSLKNNTKSGAVLIMHMSDNSIHTAKALDLYLTEMAKRTGKQAYRFACLGEALKQTTRLPFH